MTLQGVKGPTKRVGKNNFEVREDGFGTMTDEAVRQYRLMRKQRYIMMFLTELEDRVTVLEGGTP